VAVHQHGGVAVHGVKRLVDGGLKRHDFASSSHAVGRDYQLGAGVFDPLCQGLRAELSTAAFIKTPWYVSYIFFVYVL